MEINSMTDSEAVRILCLGNSFTGEEELAAYRRIIKEYHPDLWDKASSEEKINANKKVREANAAHEHLKSKYFSTSDDQKRKVTINDYRGYTSFSNGTKTPKSDLEEYKEEIKRKLYTKYNFGNFIYPEYIQKLYVNLINQLTYIINLINNTEDKYYIGSLYADALNIIGQNYRSVRKKFCSYNNIPESFVDKRISYDCSFQEFYEQLLKSKTAYESNNSKRDEYAKRLQNEIEKYKTYYGYEKIKDKINTFFIITLNGMENENFNNYTAEVLRMHDVINKYFADNLKDELKSQAEKYKDYAGYNQFVKLNIETLISKTISDAINSNFQNIEEIISKFHDSINSIFEESFSISNKINNIKVWFEDHKEYLKIKEFKDLYNKLLKYERDFSYSTDISKDLEKLEEDLASLEERYIFEKNIESNQDVIISYQGLIERYQNSLKQLNPIADKDKINKLAEVFEQAIKVFDMIRSKQVDPDTGLFWIKSITFENYDKDMKIFNVVDSVDSKIYISRNGNTFYYLQDGEDDIKFLYEDGNYSKKTIIKSDGLKTQFISLEAFLKNSTYIGRPANYDGKSAFITYKLGEKIIYTNVFGNIYLGDNANIKHYMKYGRSQKRYQDRADLVKDIEKQLEDNFELTKKKYGSSEYTKANFKQRNF